jgi:hypothetical protein
MLTRVLAVATALLAALVIHLYNQVGQLRTQVTDAQTQAVQRARSITADSMEGQSAEIERVARWVNDFYKAPDGLQRPQGLWIDGHPDFAGIGAWVFEVYLRSRLKGLSEDQARLAIEKAIKQSDEWRTKHPTAR